MSKQNRWSRQACFLYAGDCLGRIPTYLVLYLSLFLRYSAFLSCIQCSYKQFHMLSNQFPEKMVILACTVIMHCEHRNVNGDIKGLLVAAPRLHH